MRTIKLLLVAAVLALTGLPDGAQAQSGRTIRLVVPFPPGGSADILARVLSQQVGSARGVNVVVENRPGAGTVIGTDYVARAAPDANTVLIMANSFVINPHMRKLNYDPFTSFTPVVLLVTSPQVLVVNATSPYRSFADLVAASHAKPGELTMAGVGPATTQHIGFEQLKRAAGLDMTYVPFPGNAPAVTSLLGDHVTAVFATYSEAFEQLNAGKLRALATTSRTRIAPLPDLPTVAELGTKDFEVEVWFGLVVPAGSPKAAVAELAEWFTKAMQAPDVKARLDVLGLYPVDAATADFSGLLRRRSAEYAKIMQEAGIKGE
jgi:tripartite-type tricarboxylate transporter receptor subunit TctC